MKELYSSAMTNKAMKYKFIRDAEDLNVFWSRFIKDYSGKFSADPLKELPDSPLPPPPKKS